MNITSHITEPKRLWFFAYNYLRNKQKKKRWEREIYIAKGGEKVRVGCCQNSKRRFRLTRQEKTRDGGRWGGLKGDKMI
jgi:hypothetical protein